MNAIDALTEQDPQNYHEFMSECGEYAEPKMERWLSRLQGNENLAQLEKECGGSVFEVTIHCENEQEIDEVVALLYLANRMHWRKTAENPPDRKGCCARKCSREVHGCNFCSISNVGHRGRCTGYFSSLDADA